MSGSPWLRAATSLNLPEVQRAASTLTASQLLQPADGGLTIMHGIAASLYFFKAGELSTLVPWPNASRTLYAHDVRRALSRALSPVVRKLLSTAPLLATASDRIGVTPLHLACKVCSDELVDELLRAGAQPDAPLHAGMRRTPIDEAIQAGCVEVLGLLLRALGSRDMAAQHAALVQAVRYARLPGSALPTPTLLVAHPHLRASVTAARLEKAFVAGLAAAPIAASYVATTAAALGSAAAAPLAHGLPSGGRSARRLDPPPAERAAPCAEGGRMGRRAAAVAGRA